MIKPYATEEEQRQTHNETNRKVIFCACGKRTTNAHKARHERTKFHQKNKDINII